MKNFKRVFAILGGITCFVLVFFLAKGDLQIHMNLNTVEKEIASVFFFMILGTLLILSGVLSDKK